MRRPLIGTLLPSYAAGADSRADAADDVLFAEERAAVAGVAEGRRREFTTVRHCARRALTALGHAPAPLVPDARGVPCWPDGLVGSMTHCRGYRAAVVARRRDVAALGVDAEPWRPLRDGVLDTVSLPVERARLAVLEESHAGLASWDRLLFCAKEAVYKAWYPRTRTELGFRDVAVTFDPARHAFRAVVLAHGGGEFTGRWLAREGVLVAVALGGGADR